MNYTYEKNQKTHKTFVPTDVYNQTVLRKIFNNVLEKLIIDFRIPKIGDQYFASDGTLLRCSFKDEMVTTPTIPTKARFILKAAPKFSLEEINKYKNKYKFKDSISESIPVTIKPSEIYGNELVFLEDLLFRNGYCAIDFRPPKANETIVAACLKIDDAGVIDWQSHYPRFILEKTARGLGVEDVLLRYKWE